MVRLPIPSFVDMADEVSCNPVGIVAAFETSSVCTRYNALGFVLLPPPKIWVTRKARPLVPHRTRPDGVPETLIGKVTVPKGRKVLISKAANKMLPELGFETKNIFPRVASTAIEVLTPGP